MQSARRQAAIQHLKRIAIGSGFGLLAALGCAQLPEEARVPCRLAVAFLHAWVAR